MGNQAGRKKPVRGYIADYNPQQKTRDLLAQAQAVLEEYRAHWPLTLRQIYYRLVGAHAYDKTDAGYDRLGHHLANARRARWPGIPFAAIRDDGITTRHNLDWDDKDDFLEHLRYLTKNYRRDRLAGQRHHIEVWCEAAGMLPQLHKVASKYSVQVYSSGGFDSLTAKKDLANRICKIGKPTIILHLGDFDPSGAAIFDSFAADVASFVESDRPHGLVEVQFERVALTAAQVQAYGLPTAPAKASDTRSRGWKGETCQLEALPPDIIAGMVRDAIERHFDFDQMADDRAAEEEEREEIQRLLLPAPGG